MKSSAITAFFATLCAAAPASLLAPLVENKNAVPGEYMITFKDGHTLSSHETVIGKVLSGIMRHNWEEAEHFAPFGYAAKLDDILLALVRADPMVDFVEQDFTYTVNHGQQSSRNASAEEPALDKRAPTKQSNAPYNLDILSHNGKRTSGSTFFYDLRSTGTNVDLYIVDSGINIDHEEFGGRAVNFVDATETTFSDDSNIGGIRGHGTMVADIAAGTANGVAKTANILSAKIASGPNNSGRGSDAVTAIKRITRRHKQRRSESNFRGSVVNYSVDIPPPSQNKASLPQAISAADAENIIQVAAAGNANDEAFNHLPAALAEVITVASMTPQYYLSPSTSFGTAVDIIAPGTGIVAAAANSNTDTYTVSGTSFAAPHVAGVCAQFMSFATGPQTKMDLYNMLIDFSLKDLVDVQGTATPNRLVNNGAITKDWPERDELKLKSF